MCPVEGTGADLKPAPVQNSLAAPSSVRRLPGAGLAPIGVVRMTIAPIGNAVAIGVAAPAPAFQIPPVWPLHPAALMPVLTRTNAFPVAMAPYVFMAAHAPISRRPHITVARRRYDFVPHRRRTKVEDRIDLGSRRRGRRNASKRCGQQCNKQWFSQHDRNLLIGSLIAVHRPSVAGAIHGPA